MTDPSSSDSSKTAAATPPRPRRSIHRWIRFGFITWAIISTSYIINSFRTQGVDPKTLQTSDTIAVNSTSELLEFQPQKHNDVGIVFICGAGVAAEAYAPLLRPLADDGYPVKIVRLPWRVAPFESNKLEAIRRAIACAEDKNGPRHWVLSGHSLGAALSCRVIQEQPSKFSALVLIGTTHPKADNLSQLSLPVTKVFGDKDGVAPKEDALANKSFLPPTTTWYNIEGGNHSQFGHYGWQILDGRPGIPREEQQEQTRAAILKTIKQIGK
jgi:pimeloyl-ACP methyl ester carboxylesterase